MPQINEIITHIMRLKQRNHLTRKYVDGANPEIIRELKRIIRCLLLSDARIEISDIAKEVDISEKITFDMDKIRRPSERGGFGRMAWEDLDLQSNLDSLVRKGWIDEIGEGEYQISDAGIEGNEGVGRIGYCFPSKL
jgi:hypothetical protein